MDLKLSMSSAIRLNGDCPRRARSSSPRDKVRKAFWFNTLVSGSNMAAVIQRSLACDEIIAQAKDALTDMDA